MSKILILCPYPLYGVPSQRFRFEQYLSQLREKRFRVVVKPFFTERAYAAFYHSGRLIPKISAISQSYIRRYLLFLHIAQADFVFIHRETTPAGPPFFEWLLAKVLGRKIIYDFDDAIWLTDLQNESWLARTLRWRNKVGAICQWSYKVSCGNAYLADYARRFNPRVIVNPTTIDSSHHRPVEEKFSTVREVTIGWTGSHSTLKYLDAVIPTLQLLEKKYSQIRILIIADKDPALPLSNVTFQQWQRETEINDLARIDIGIMPLPDDPWTRGKCGFKALQYMAMEIPALVSPVGVNREIVQDGVQGYWCSTDAEWCARLEELILDPEKRLSMGKQGRKRVIDSYSVNSNADNFLSLFQ